MINFNKVKRFCCEDISLIENYNEALNDINETWHCHHRLEIQNNKVIKVAELIKQNLYFKRPASELIFLREAEHRSIHAIKIFKGRKKSELEIQKIKDSKKGSIPWNKGKTEIYSEETRQKMKESRKLKFKWEDPTGEIHIMCKCNARRYHQDWKLIE